MVIRFKKSLIMTLILIVSLASAGTSWAATVPTGVLYKISLSDDEIFVEMGAESSLMVTGSYKDGTTVTESDVTSDIVWKNEHTDIATIHNGTIKAKNPGEFKATATIGGLSQDLSIIVTKKVKSLVTEGINGSVDLRKNAMENIVLIANYTDNSKPEDVTNKAVWSTSSSKIASVNNGLITALSAGTTKITATYGNQIAIIKVNVEVLSRLDLSVDKVSLLLKDPKKPTINDSQTVKLTATYLNGKPEKQDVTTDAVWSTSNKNVADVLKGKITAYKAGTAIITASYGTETITLKVEVDKTLKLVTSKKNVFLSLLSKDADKETIIDRTKEVLKLEAVYPDKVDPVDVTELADWTSSNESVAYVNKGAIYAEGTGSATITGKYGDKSVTVRVDVDVPRHLDLMEELGMSVGDDSPDLELMADFAGVIDSRDVAPEAVWSSSDEAIVYVLKGKLTAYKMGVATISATYGGITVTTKVSVDIPTKISLNSKLLNINVDDTYNARLNATYGKSTSDIKLPKKPDENLTSKAEWSTSDEEIAEVNSDGLITGVATGKATITAVYDKVKYTMQVNVGLVSVLESESQLIILSSIGDEKSVVKKSELIDLTVKISSSSDDSTPISVTDATWKSSNPSVASVKDGLVTGYTKGKAAITAEYGGQKVTISVEVDVIQNLESTHQSVLLKTGSKGPKEEQIKVTATFSDGKAMDVTNLAEWKTSSYKIATVNKGKVSAVAYGKTKISAKYAGKTLSIPVEVDMLKYLQTDEVSLNMKVKDEVRVIATATYVDESEDDVSKAALWTSSRILTATVKDGKIKATGKGKATITVSYGGKKIKVIVVVE